MRIILAFILLFFLLPNCLDAQITQTIRGTIIDKESKIPLIGANAVVVNSNPLNGTIADVKGYFNLTVPVGTISIKITYIGYEDVIIPEIHVVSGKETFLNIEMRESVVSMQEVTVKAFKNKSQTVNSMASVSARMISTVDANRYAAGYSDPSRMVSSFAGVAPTEGDKNNIVIRGNSPRGLLWRLEGIEVPSPNHFGDGQGDSGGAFCIINSNLMSNSDFYTGAFPGEYGNALAGILDLNLRKGNSNKYEHAVQIGIVGMEFTTEGPLGKKGASYLASYRFSNFKFLQDIGLIDLGKSRRAPKFQDFAFNINLPTSKAGLFSLFGVAGTSTTGFYGVADSLKWKEDDDYQSDEVEIHSVGIIGLKHSIPLTNKKSYLKTIVAVTAQYDKWDERFMLSDKDKWYKGSLNNGYASFSEVYNTFLYPSLQSTTTINHKINANHALRAGVVFSLRGYDMYAREYNYDRAWQENRAIYDVLVDRSDYTSLTQAFVQWKYRMNERIELNTGLHSLFFALNKRYSLEPRLGMKWQLSDKFSLSYGFGIHSRIESIASYYTYIFNPDGSYSLPNKDINFTRAIHNVIGYDWAITSDIRFKAEIYHQYLYDIPVKDDPNSTESALNASYGLPDTIYSNKGLGENYGLELTLEKFFSKNYYFLVTASLFESKFKAGDGVWYNSVFNSNYVTNCFWGKISKRGKISRMFSALILKYL